MRVSFYDSELRRQMEFRRKGGFAAGSDAAGHYQGQDREFVFDQSWEQENLFCETEPGQLTTTREWAWKHFEKLAWHKAHRHLLSSQVACVNFLAPFAQRPEALAHLLSEGIYGGRTVKPEQLPGENGFVAFEWISDVDLLNEQVGDKPRTRGANCTSVDAAVLVDVKGVGRELLLIEWKYVEKYGSRLSGGERSRRVRELRYADIAFDPHGPIKADLDLWLTDFFYEPFYQLLRQQMLAYQVERRKELGLSAVRVLHVSPTGNRELNTVTSHELLRRYRRLVGVTYDPQNISPFQLWPHLLVEPDRFTKRSWQELFGGFDAAAHGMSEWRDYAGVRYGLRDGAADGSLVG